MFNHFYGDLLSPLKPFDPSSPPPPPLPPSSAQFGISSHGHASSQTPREGREGGRDQPETDRGSKHSVDSDRSDGNDPSSKPLPPSSGEVGGVAGSSVATAPGSGGGGGSGSGLGEGRSSVGKIMPRSGEAAAAVEVARELYLPVAAMVGFDTMRRLGKFMIYANEI